MVARGPDDRPDLTVLAPLTLKGLRRLRGARPPQMAADLQMSLRAYEHFENGKGRLNVDRIHAFAGLLNADPFAILAAFDIGSPDFALRCANNKLMMIFMSALQEFDAEAQDTIVGLDPLTLLESFTAFFSGLAAKAREQEAVISQWRCEKALGEAEDSSQAPEGSAKPDETHADED
jgi:transcriptional regulator with XRE-family HTH domain